MSATLALAERFFAAIEAGDLEGVRQCYAPDAVIWRNTDGLDHPGQGRDANVATLAWMLLHVTGLTYEVVKREETRFGFLQQHVLRATTTLGEAVALPAVILCTVADGAIARLEEFVREADAAPLFRAAQASQTR